MNYNDYYNYVNGYSDMNYMTNPNNMISDLNMQSLYPSAIMPSTNNSNVNGNILDTFEGFKRGNMFKNLYDQYKNYKPDDLKASSEREDMLMQLQEIRFAMIDLGLYLDVYPNDKNALSLFNSYLKKEKELCKMFESKYGPLTFDSEVQVNGWLWDNGPWPWEVQK